MNVDTSLLVRSEVMSAGVWKGEGGLLCCLESDSKSANLSRCYDEGLYFDF